MSDYMIKIFIVLLLLLILSLVPIWPVASIFGEWKINSLEYFGGCWQGDVRLCDYNPFD